MSFSISEPSTRTSVSVSLISMGFLLYRQPGASRARNLGAAHGILSSLSNISKLNISLDTSMLDTSMIEQTVLPRVSIDQLIRELHTFPESTFDQTEEILLLLAKMPVEDASLAPYLSWDRQHYTRNLIDKTDVYELMAICWEVG